MSILAQALLLIITWASAQPDRSFKIIVRATFRTAISLDLTALVQILRKQLRYYDLAVTEQLIVLTLVPLGCTLLRPGWKAFQSLEKIATVISAGFAMGWSIYLQVWRSDTWSLETGCRERWLGDICEAITNVQNTPKSFTCVMWLDDASPVQITNDTIRSQLSQQMLRTVTIGASQVTAF